MLLLLKVSITETFTVCESRLIEGALVSARAAIPTATSAVFPSVLPASQGNLFPAGIAENLTTVVSCEIRERALLFVSLEATLMDHDDKALEFLFQAAIPACKQVLCSAEIRAVTEFTLALEANIGRGSLTEVLIAIPCSSPAVLKRAFVANITGASQEELLAAFQYSIMEAATMAEAFFVLDSLYDPPPAFFPETDWDIFLGDISIKSMLTSASVSYSRSAPHNNLSLSSADMELFSMTAALSVETVTKVVIDEREMLFVLEDRSIGSEDSFSLKGRSLSILRDIGYSESVDFDISTPGWGLTDKMLEDRGETRQHFSIGRVSVKTVIDFLLEGNLEWGVGLPEWILYSFSSSGTIMEIVIEIAAIARAIVRCLDDGTIYVGPKRKARPIDVYSTSPDQVFTRSTLIENNEDSLDYGSGENAITVHGFEPEIDLPDLEVEESSPVVGQDIHIRAFWKGKRTVYFDPESGSTFTLPVETFVTDGFIKDIGNGIAVIGLSEDGVDDGEAITFSEGKASVGKPIHKLISCDWIGDAWGSPSFTKFEKELTISGQWGLGKVIYESAYIRYLISGTNVKAVLMALVLQEKSGVFLDLRMQRDGVLGTVYAENVTDQRLTSMEIAAFVGTTILDERRYDRFSRGVTIPYSGCVDGDLVAIENPKLSFSGNHYVDGATIEFDGPAVTQNLDLSQFLL